MSLYNLLAALEKSKRQQGMMGGSGGGGGGVGNSAIFTPSRLHEGTVACRADVGVLEDRKEAMEQELVHMKPLGSRAWPDTNSEPTMQQAAGVGCSH
jgi:hypothetical protein